MFGVCNYIFTTKTSVTLANAHDTLMRTGKLSSFINCTMASMELAMKQMSANSNVWSQFSDQFKFNFFRALNFKTYFLLKMERVQK